MLLGTHDISSADGLEPGALQRALRVPAEIVQPLVPTAVPPTASSRRHVGGDLGGQLEAGA
jgi:hypothetical protein